MKLSKTQWRHWRIATLVYVPNAVAANILLSQLHPHTVGLLGILVAALVFPSALLWVLTVGMHP